jgi:CRISPR/Cas system CSM-associated protein Csm3 (group 7 of RAMP superfamily)
MKYSIRFYTYWHCGSGLSGGSSSDATVIRDRDGLPFVPGKTLKGHLREASKLLFDDDFVRRCFGEEDRYEGQGRFGDAILPVDLGKADSKYLYHRLSATKIDPESGTAMDDTLRSIEAVVPLTLYGTIEGLSEEDEEKMLKAMKLVKRIGLRRHRGLGRCDISKVRDGGER